MAWIESHQSLERHPKTYDLMSAMGWDLDTAMGKLHRFWYWCVDYAEDGDLRKHNDGRLASAVGLNSDLGKRLVEAMVHARWLDREPYFRVHDWWQYIGKYLQIKYKHSPEKWQAVRDAYKNGSKNGSENVIPTNQPTNHGAGEKNPAEVEAERREAARSFAVGWITAECPRWLKKSATEPFARIVSNLGKEEAVRQIQELMADEKIGNPFAYLEEKLSRQHLADQSRKAKQPKPLTRPVKYE